MQTYAHQLREPALTYRIRRDIHGDAIRFGGTAADTHDVAKILLAILADEPAEVFGLLCVTPRHRVIGYHEVCRGVLVPSNIQPRDVFRVAILANADAIICDFVYLQPLTGLTKGNLSNHLQKLEQAGLIDIVKTFRGRTPRTVASLTSEGREAIDRTGNGSRHFDPRRPPLARRVSERRRSDAHEHAVFTLAGRRGGGCSNSPADWQSRVRCSASTAVARCPNCCMSGRIRSPPQHRPMADSDGVLRRVKASFAALTASPP